VRMRRQRCARCRQGSDKPAPVGCLHFAFH
jgi:hypothetical protein